MFPFQNELIIPLSTLFTNAVQIGTFDYRKTKSSLKQFVADHWNDYLDIVNAIEADDDTKESLLKIILYRILTRRQYIRDIKRGANL